MDAGYAPCSNNGSKPSVVWKIFRRIGICEGQEGVANPVHYVRCSLCSKTMTQHWSSTSCMRRHIRTHHETELQELLVDSGEADFETLVKDESSDNEKSNETLLPLRATKRPSQTQPITGTNVNLKIRKLQRCVNRLDASMGALEKIPSQNRTIKGAEQDPDFVYGQLVAIELKGLCPAVSIQAKADIFNVLAEAHKKSAEYMALHNPSVQPDGLSGLLLGGNMKDV